MRYLSCNLNNEVRPAVRRSQGLMLQKERSSCTRHLRSRNQKKAHMAAVYGEGGKRWAERWAERWAMDRTHRAFQNLSQGHMESH
jgi:hypothetical protein